MVSHTVKYSEFFGRADMRENGKKISVQGSAYIPGRTAQATLGSGTRMRCKVVDHSGRAQVQSKKVNL